MKAFNLKSLLVKGGQGDIEVLVEVDGKLLATTGVETVDGKRIIKTKEIEVVEEEVVEEVEETPAPTPAPEAPVDEDKTETVVEGDDTTETGTETGDGEGEGLPSTSPAAGEE